jgi:serine/threonine kinase 32/serum/glucocorticoid-regulated kinase 2
MFKFDYVIGRGGFGKVWKVEKKNNKGYFALKEMSKAKVIAKRSERSVLNERSILSKLSSNFIINIAYAFQDRENLYLIMDLLIGGDLRYHFSKRKKFNENETRSLYLTSRLFCCLYYPWS